MIERHTVPFSRSEPVPGVRVTTESMPHVRSVSLGLWIDVGSRDESDAEAGAAHLLEHLLFKGTRRRSAREIAEAFDAVGGDLNAYTSREHTCYYARVLDEDLALAADVLFDMYRNALLRSEDLDSERKVVLEEIHMSDDSPEDRVHDLWAEHALPGHPLRRPVIGWADTVGSIDRDRLEAFYRTYEPGRLVVGAAGNVSHEAVVSWVEGAVPGGELRRRGLEGTPPVPPKTAVYEPRATEQAHIVWGGGAIERTHPDRFALGVLNALYGSGTSSRLFQRIREERGLAYSVYSGYSMYLDTGLFSVGVGTNPSAADEVLAIVRDEARSLAAGEVASEEVERAKGQMKGSLVLSMDDPSGRMFRLGRSELVHGHVLAVDELLARVDAVTPEDVTRVARRLFGGDGFVLGCVGQVEPGDLDRHTEPL